MRLILTRHAKARSEIAGGDRARPLSERGHASAAAIGAWLAGKGYAPDLVLSSDAVRTRQTWAGMARHLPRPERVIWLPELYLATAEDMMQVLRGAGTARCVLLLGHNPGIAMVAADMVARPPDHPRFDAYPTCATLVAEIGVESWDAVSPGTARVLDFAVPRDLTG